MSLMIGNECFDVEEHALDNTYMYLRHPSVMMQVRYIRVLEWSPSIFDDYRTWNEFTSNHHGKLEYGYGFILQLYFVRKLCTQVRRSFG